MSIRNSIILIALLAATPALAEGVVSPGRSGGTVTPTAPSPIVPVPITPPGSIAANGSFVSACAPLTTISRIDFAATLSQAGTLKINRYLDTSCARPVAGNPVQGAAAATVPAAIGASDGIQAQSYTVEIDNTTGSASTVTNAVLLISPIAAITGAPTYTDANGNQVQPVMPICNGAACSQANPAYTTFAAGEFHVGEFGNNQQSIATSFTPTAATYTAGFAVGNLQTLAGAARVSAAAGNPGTSGNVLSSVLTFPIAVTVPFDVVYFNATPGAGTCADNTAFALVAADIAKVVGVAHLTDLTVGNPATIVQAVGPPLPYTLASATSLFACVVTRGAPTLTAASVNLGVRVLRQ